MKPAGRNNRIIAKPRKRLRGFFNAMKIIYIKKETVDLCRFFFYFRLSPN